MIIITCCNNLALTKACLNSALAQEPAVRVVLVNNASDDMTGSWMHTLDPRKVFLMSFLKRVSVAKMWNAALDWAWRRGETKALMVNNDTVLRPDTHRELAARVGNEMVTAISVRSLEAMHGEWLSTDGKGPDFSCFMISRAAHRLLRFDERYEGSYCEDTEWHAMAHTLGIRAWNCGIPFFHVGAATVKNSSPEEQKRIHLRAEKNRELFYSRWNRRVGTAGYDDLFTPERFGSRLVRCA